MIRNRFVFVIFNPLLIILCLLLIFWTAKSGWIDLGAIANAAQPWQALIASLIALIAAAAAYSAALARIYFDSQIATFNSLRTHLGILTRLRFFCLDLAEQVIVFRSAIINEENDWPKNWKKFSRFDFLSGEELHEAWAAVELVPVDLIPHLAALRDYHATALRAADRLRELQSHTPYEEAREQLMRLERLCSKISQHVFTLSSGLEVAIKRAREAVNWDT